MQVGQYYAQLQPCIEVFGEHKLKVIRLRDLISRREETLTKVYQFLEVDDDFRLPAAKPHNVGGIPLSVAVQQFTKGQGVASHVKRFVRSVVPDRLYDWIKWKIHHKNKMIAPPLPPSVRALIIPLYKQDVLRLSASTDVDTVGWVQLQPELNA